MMLCFGRAASGNTSASMFQGFGSNRLVLSRLTECTPELVGPTDDVDTPTPCVLRKAPPLPVPPCPFIPAPSSQQVVGASPGGASAALLWPHSCLWLASLRCSLS